MSRLGPPLGTTCNLQPEHIHLEWQILGLNVPQAEAEHVIQPDSMADGGSAGRAAVSITLTHTACSSATTFSGRIAYDNRSHPVLRLRLFIGSGCDWEPFAGPVQLDPVLWHLVGINKSLEYRFGASLG